MVYRILVLTYFFLIIQSFNSKGQNFTDREIIDKLSEEITKNNKKKKVGEIEYAMMIDVKSRIDTLSVFRKKLSELENQLNQLNQSLNTSKFIEVPCKPIPPLTNIKTTAWTSQNLTKEELHDYFGLKIISEALSEADWEAAHKEKRPAFCYHKWDISKEYGILLNVHALTVLRNKLNEHGAEFRFPTADDIKNLNEVARSLKLNSLQIYALNSDPKQTGSSSWKMQTHDLFNFILPALSYRRDLEDDEWHGGSAASFYCDNPKDPNWNEGLVLAELSVSSKFWEFLPGMITSGDYSNIGTYVRLIFRD